MTQLYQFISGIAEIVFAAIVLSLLMKVKAPSKKITLFTEKMQICTNHICLNALQTASEEILDHLTSNGVKTNSRNLSSAAAACSILYHGNSSQIDRILRTGKRCKILVARSHTTTISRQIISQTKHSGQLLYLSIDKTIEVL